MNMVVLSYDDWEALYIDGVVAKQGHHVTVTDLAHASGGQPFCLVYQDASGALEQYVTDMACFPDSLAEAMVLAGK